MRNNTIPALNQVVPISGSYSFSEEDSIASIQATWGGGTVTLPGPDSGHATPNNGDTYTVFDGQNALLATGKPLTVSGGGYRFLSGGTLVSQTTLTAIVATTNGSIQKSCIQFVFDAAAGVWLVC